MYDHNSTVYINNNCVKKAPNKNPLSKKFDQKFLNQVHNEVTKNMSEKLNIDFFKENHTIIDFLESIPEYDDINHLSNQEFYKKLEKLKEKQRKFSQYVKNDQNKEIIWMNNNEEKLKKKSISNEETASLSDKDASVKVSSRNSRRSVRIETPGSSSTIPERFPLNFQNEEFDEFSMENSSNTDLPNRQTKSAPNTPIINRKYDGITVPKPFQMTIRDEENKIVDELFLKINQPKEKNQQEKFKAHEIPIESQIPLFDKIMEKQQKRSQNIKEKRKADLKSQMRPFSFTKRDEEIQELTKQFSKSLPCVYNDAVPFKVKKFKAKPIPKNLFSNYIYRKMHEDEFYRTLQKKVRAEEMLKHASLPPSMAKRNNELIILKEKFYDVCPRRFKDIYHNHQENNNNNKLTKKKRKIPNFKSMHDKYERELEELKNEFISTSPRPFKFNKTTKNKRNKKRASSATSTDEISTASVNRSNLAAVLRIEAAKKRLELEMEQKLEEAKMKEEIRWREKLLRKKPVWQSLSYSNADDLAMRLQLRRDEEKYRRDEHKINMEMMLDRVYQQPTLFERQTTNLIFSNNSNQNKESESSSEDKDQM